MNRTAEWVDGSQIESLEYERWRHGGWYWFSSTHDRWPNGGCGCVSRNYEDRKWRIVCDEREGDFTYPTRKAAALAERELMRAANREEE